MATIQGVYVALFGRPADPTGLTYFNSVTKNGADLSGIGDLASTQEYKDRFAGQNNTQIVNSIYQSLFGRDAEAAGLTFFVNALNTGTLNIKNIAIAILDGAQGTDKTTVTTKVAAADLYTKSLDTAQEIGSYQGNAAAAQGRAFLAGVTTTVPTQAAVDAAILAMQAAGAAGNTIALTNGTDELSLTKGIVNGTATVFTTNNNDTINAKDAGAAANAWDPVADKVDGGLGVDTLNATMYVATAVGTTGKVAAGGLVGVENLYVTSSGVATGLDLAAATGLAQVWNDTSTGNFTAQGLGLSVTAGLKGALGANTSTFVYTDADSSSSVNLALNAATATGSVTIANAGTVNVSNTGTSSISDLVIDAKTVAVSGSGDLNIVFNDANLETVNASAFTGNQTSNLGGNDKLKTVTLGSGNDNVTIDVNHTNDIKIDAGAGNDTINVINDAGAASKAVALTGGAGADSFIFGATGGAGYLKNVVVSGTPTAAEVTKTLITIADFDKSADAIKFYVAGGAATGKANLTGADLATISSQSDILAAATKAAELANTNSGTGHVAVFAFGGDTYIYEDSNASGTFNTGDALVKVTGLTDVTALTATNFVLIA